MPIVGMTTQAPQFPVMGKLRKGGAKSPNRPGKDLDYFRYTSETHPESVSAFNHVFSKPQAITVMLPYSTVDENFDAWMEAWQKTRLLHRCDGEYVSMIYDAQRKTYVRPKNTACPGGCKQVGRLNVIVPDLLKAGHVGTVTLETHSKWDIIGIHESLSAYYSMRGNLQGIEFTLYRYQKEISTPEHGRQMKWLVGIKPNHEWIVAQLGVQAQAALPSSVGSFPSEDAILIGSGDSTEDSDDIEDAEFTEAEPAVNTKEFHACGRELYGDEWDNKRPSIVKHFGDGAESSKDLTQDQVYKALLTMQERLHAINRIWKLDPIYNGDLNALLEERKVLPLYNLTTKQLNALNDDLKGSGDDKPAQPKLVEDQPEYA